MDSASAALRRIGLNIVGVADGAAYQHILPGCRSVVVYGSGGRALWDAFVDDLRDHPEHLAEEPHPLDEFVLRAIRAADPSPPPTRRWVRAAADEEVVVDFQRLAVEAGLGWRSLLGLVLHPGFGPWLGLRAACFTTELLPRTGPLAGAGPCVGCPAPCRPACPAGAIGVQGWDLARCAAFHQESSRCHGTCHSRRACPIGAEHAYSAEQLGYHEDPRAGRKRLAARLGIDDRCSGSGLPWTNWT